MQFKFSSLVALLALSAPLMMMAESVASSNSSSSAIPNIKDVVKTPAPAPEGRTLGLLLPLIGGVFKLLFGSGGYNSYGGYVKPCGSCGGTKYYGSNNGYYGFYSQSQNIRYINNYDGTYTLNVFGLYTGSSNGALAVTCPNSAFRFTPYNQGYYCQINQNSQCYSRVV